MRIYKDIVLNIMHIRRHPFFLKTLHTIFVQNHQILAVGHKTHTLWSHSLPHREEIRIMIQKTSHLVDPWSNSSHRVKNCMRLKFITKCVMYEDRGDSSVRESWRQFRQGRIYVCDETYYLSSNFLWRVNM